MAITQGRAGGNIDVADGILTPLGYEQVTSIGAAKGLTPPAGATKALIQGETSAVRWRDDGTDPTTLLGMRIVTNGELFYTGVLSAIKFIDITSGAILNVSYYK